MKPNWGSPASRAGSAASAHSSPSCANFSSTGIEVWQPVASEAAALDLGVLRAREAMKSSSRACLPSRPMSLAML